MASFISIKLDILGIAGYGLIVNAAKTQKSRRSASATVRGRVARGGQRLWKHSDFADLPSGAVAQALSRLSREAVLQRVAKGVYYHSEPTSFGPSIPSSDAVAAETFNAPVHPSGLSAANVLGLSTQNPRRGEFATHAAAAPRALRNAVVHTGRPLARTELTTEEGAILEFLRQRGVYSDLPPDATAERLRRLLADDERFRRLVRAARSEPPRVRAMLGALGEELHKSPKLLGQLRRDLNPLSRFDFGRLESLRYAREWQAK